MSPARGNRLATSTARGNRLATGPARGNRLATGPARGNRLAGHPWHADGVAGTDPATPSFGARVTAVTASGEGRRWARPGRGGRCVRVPAYPRDLPPARHRARAPTWTSPVSTDPAGALGVTRLASEWATVVRHPAPDRPAGSGRPGRQAWTAQAGRQPDVRRERALVRAGCCR